MTVTPLTTAAEVLLATDHDPFARGSLRHAMTTGWLGEGGAVAWLGVDPHAHQGVLSALGEPPAVAALVADLLPELPPRQRVTLPRGTAALLPAWVGLQGTHWDFRWLAEPPPGQPGEERVGALHDEEAVRSLLAEASPTASALPGAPDVRAWVGVVGAGGLLACAADTTTIASVGHLKSIAVHPRVRGQGLGRAVTAALTRPLLAGGCDVVTLGTYADNEVGRALYDGLGFADAHRFTSGSMVVRSRW